MSLVICSNLQDDYLKKDNDGVFINMRGVGSSAPNSFTNHFSSVFKIAPNSEVAVQSVKIERNSLAVINGNKFFSIFLGPGLSSTTSYRDQTCLPICVRLKEGRYGVMDLSKELERCWKDEALDFHPDSFGMCKCAPQYSLANNSSDFTGYLFEYNGSGKADAINTAQAMTSWVKAGRNGADTDYSVANGNNSSLIVKRDLATGGTFKYAIGRGKLVSGGGGVAVDGGLKSNPLSMVNGEFEIQIPTDLGQYWECGLTRAVNEEHPAPDWFIQSSQALTEGSSYEAGFMDYKLTWAPRPDGVYGLIIEQAIADEGGVVRTDGSAKFRMVECKYFGRTSPNGLENVKMDSVVCRGAHDGSANTYYTRFKFKAIGELMTLEAYKETKAGGTWVPLIDGRKDKALMDSEVGAYNYPSGNAYKVPSAFKPINQNCWNLYPKIGLLEKDDTIQINKWGGKQDSGIFPENNTTPGTAFWARQWDEDGGESFGQLFSMKEVINIDKGILQNGIQETATYTCKLLTADGEGVDYKVGILPQATDPVNRGVNFTEKNKYDSYRGNCADILGFQQMTEVINDRMGNTFNKANQDLSNANGIKWIVGSSQKPVFSSHTCFVSCPTLTHQSLNMAKQLPSKILYHIPRFSNSGKEFGNLFFESPEKSYLKLNNSEELNLNELQLDIKNTDETYARDLQGQTTIVLHFRKSRD